MERNCQLLREKLNKLNGEIESAEMELSSSKIEVFAISDGQIVVELGGKAQISHTLQISWYCDLNRL